MGKLIIVVCPTILLSISLLSSVDSSVREDRLNRFCRQVAPMSDPAKMNESFFSPKSIEEFQGDSFGNPLSLSPSPEEKRNADYFKKLKAGIKPGVSFEDVSFEAENSRAVVRVKELQEISNQIAYRKYKIERDKRAGKITGSGSCLCCCGAFFGILFLAGAL